MTTESVNSAHLAAALEALRQEVARLSERVAALEQAPVARPVPTPPVATPAAPAAAPLAAEGVSEEIILVISAAIAAFLGKKPHIRQIRLLTPAGWAQEGRVTIQASHALSTRHARS